MNGRLVCLAAAVILASVCAGCAPATPSDTVDAYVDAVRSDDPEAAWAMLSPDGRGDLTYAAFERDWTGYREALPATLDVDRAAAVRAAVRDGDRDVLQLVLTPQGWRITGPVLSGHRQRTPRAALQGFIRAMEHRDYPRLMTYVPERYAQHMTEETLAVSVDRSEADIDTLMRQLKANADNPIEERANRAYMEYGPKRVVFVKEGDLWKIDDPDESTPAF